jgi:hypothetical protein
MTVALISAADPATSTRTVTHNVPFGRGQDGKAHHRAAAQNGGYLRPGADKR